MSEPPARLPMPTELELYYAEPGLLAAGELELSSITLDGVAIALDGVLADVTIRHGRAGFFDSASPSTAQLTLLGVTRAMMRPFRLGSELVINATDGASVARRFTGRLTDAELDVDELTAIAVGRLRTLSGYTVGTVAYPEERWSDRVVRAFTDAGLFAPGLIADGGFEASSAGWSTWGSDATVARSAEQAKRGSYSLKVVATTAGHGTQAHPILPVSTPVTVELCLYSAVAQTIGLSLLDSAFTNLIVAYPVLSAGVWSRVKVSGLTSPVGGSGYLALTSTIAPSTFYVDEVFVYPTDAPPVLELDVGTFDPIMVARPAEPVLLSTMLDELAAMVQAAVADRPDGRILVQALGARSVGVVTPLDPAEVAYAPVWEQRLPGSNVVTVTYGAADPQASVTSSDAASVALYGPIPVTIETELRDVAAANQVLQNRLGRDAFSHWTIPDAPLLVGRRLAVGQAVRLSTLPSSAPWEAWSSILEGWTDRVTADADGLDWTMELALSDPLLSGITLAWGDVPNDAAHRWNTINATVAWRDALTLDDLTP